MLTIFSSLFVSIFTVFPADIIESLFNTSLVFPLFLPSIVIFPPANTFPYSVSPLLLTFSFNGIVCIFAVPVFSVYSPSFPRYPSIDSLYLGNNRDLYLSFVTLFATSL